MADQRRFDTIERVVRDTRRQVDDLQSTVMARFASHTHAGGGGGAVDSVNGQTGVVVLDAADVGAQPVDSDLTTIAGLAPADGTLLKRVAGAWAASTLTGSDVGLGNVDNTSDANKPVSTAQQTALNLKLDTSAAPELIRDTMGTALVAGTNITITPDDGADTITIAASGGGGAVDSVNGQTGTVVLDAADVGALTQTAADALYIADSTVDAKGDLLAGTAADTVARLPVGSNDQVLTADSTQTAGMKWATVSAGGGGPADAASHYVDANESTSSTSYTDLATVGPTVTVDVGPAGVAIVTTGMRMLASSGEGFASFAVSGANTLAASDENALELSTVTAGILLALRVGRAIVLTGLNAGATTFTMKYKQTDSACNFRYRKIGVVTF